MRLFEFDNQLAAAVKSNLLFLKSLTDENNVIKVDALVNLLKKQHILFSYDGLKELFDTDPSLKNIIKDFNKEEITIADPDEADDSGLDLEAGDDLEQTDAEAEIPSEYNSDEEDDEEEGESVEDKIDNMAKPSKGKDRVASMASKAAKRRS
jgi:uncharacterized protein YjcR